MAIVNPFYAIGSDVYHNNSRCTEGNNIEPINRMEGDGNGTKRLCKRCKELNKEE